MFRLIGYKLFAQDTCSSYEIQTLIDKDSRFIYLYLYFWLNQILFFQTIKSKVNFNATLRFYES